ncbi:unnamed protein product [Cochlearia groenlandica]
MQGPQSTGDSSTGRNYADGEPICNTNPETTSNNMLNPVDAQFPNNASSSSDAVQNHNWWSFGGGSSSTLEPSNQVNSVGSKAESHSSRNGPFFLRGSSSNHMLAPVNLGKDLDIDNSGLKTSEVVTRHNNNRDNSLGSSSQTVEERSSYPSSSSSSLGGLGPSCKRKALEGAPSHSFPGGSTSCFFNEGPAQYDASSSLSLSTPSQDSPNLIAQSHQTESRFGIGGGRIAPSSRSNETLSTPDTRLGSRQPHESVAFSFSPFRGSVPHRQPSPAASPFVVDPLDESAVPITGSESQPSMIHLPALTRNIHQFAWDVSSSSRTNNMPGGEGIVPPWDSSRVNADQPVFPVPATETINPVQEQFNWSFSRGDSSFVSPHEVAPWSLFPSAESESESATRGATSSLPLLPSGPSVTLNEAATASGSSSRSQRYRERRSRLLMERQNELLHLRHLGRSLANDNNDGRNRLVSEIRQVLSAMRRGENLRFEDYAVFDPLIFSGIAEMHDRHRDMRLDVDNMSYEELLALGERIGDVSTGLSEEVIMKAMKQHKHTSSSSSAVESHQDKEPCCVCQEEYVEGDDLGTLGCGHEFHTLCVKQWLMLKNLCPICKTIALST